MAERIVSESMSPKHVVSVGPHASIMEAACLMTKANCSSVLVVDSAGNLQGIVTERDLMTRVVAKALSPEKTEVSAVMTPQPCCIGPDMLVSDAVLMMIEHGFRHLPILSPTKKILGVIAVRDASPRELLDAVSLAEFHEQVNDALG